MHWLSVCICSAVPIIIIINQFIIPSRFHIFVSDGVSPASSIQSSFFLWYFVFLMFPLSLDRWDRLQSCDMVFCDIKLNTKKYEWMNEKWIYSYMFAVRIQSMTAEWPNRTRFEWIEKKTCKQRNDDDDDLTDKLDTNQLILTNNMSIMWIYDGPWALFAR